MSDKSSQLKRGFKTWAENTSLSYRDRLKSKATSPINVFALARHLDVRVLDLRKMLEAGVDPDTVSHLCSPEGDEWSAFTVCYRDNDVIVLNPSHSRERLASDMAHELSHLILQHKPAQIFIDPSINVSMRHFDKSQENEAAWLSGCLLLPRPALVHVARCRMSDDEVIRDYSVSQQMLNYRRSVSGANKQFRPRSS